MANALLSSSEIPGLTLNNNAKFLPRNLNGWFRRGEALFKASNISTETTQYTYINIPERDKEYANDVLDDPENDRKYTKIMEVLIQGLSDYDSQKIQKLLAPIQIGDQALPITSTYKNNCRNIFLFTNNLTVTTTICLHVSQILSIDV